MVDVQQLVWVHQNRQRRTRGRHVGELMGALARRVSTEEGFCSLELVSIIRDTVDEEFLCHCRLAGVSRRTVVINVDLAPLIYSMRQRWSGILDQALTTRRRGRIATNVVFAYGKAGTALQST